MHICGTRERSLYNIPVLVQTMAWCRPGDKPLSEQKMVVFTDTQASFGLNELNMNLHLFAISYCITRYCCEGTNPALTKKLAGGRPPGLQWNLFALWLSCGIHLMQHIQVTSWSQSSKYGGCWWPDVYLAPGHQQHAWWRSRPVGISRRSGHPTQ